MLIYNQKILHGGLFEDGGGGGGGIIRGLGLNRGFTVIFFTQTHKLLCGYVIELNKLRPGGQKLFSFSIYWKTGIFLKYGVTSLCSNRHIAYSFLLIKFISIKRHTIPHRTIGGTIGYC